MRADLHHQEMVKNFVKLNCVCLLTYDLDWCSQALQDDYRRFMNYTDGKFHSDYLIKLRYTGMQLAEKRVSDVTYEDIEELFNPRRNGELH